MLIAWSDHEARPTLGFDWIPLINAYALIWCFMLHHSREMQLILANFSVFAPFWLLNIKYQCVSFLQLFIEPRT